MRRKVCVALSTKLLEQSYQGNFDTGILVGGGDDYLAAVRKAKELGKKIEFAGFNVRAGSEFTRTVDKFTSLDEIVNKVLSEPER
ncbi:hypothetical protein AKJ54_00175 [candidate division MSBL1 archaeon SCGC-AAA382K21]|uniref:NYN domain-containing protein n=1 Tax=candidate division MSBL1 archaeon SCGC-AAA382K21 TaxID=1698283 RepID=A0A133VM30_9EURY|nr:hypothetical protein AKJ54_00175 [candidate division MSBL1 archaeon SCGC-AAA382K21]